MEFYKVVVRIVCGDFGDEDKETLEKIEKESYIIGSGFFISENKIVTASHVISNYFDLNESVYVNPINMEDSTFYKAKVIETEENSMIAILELQKKFDIVGLKFTSNYTIKPQTDAWMTFGHPGISWNKGVIKSGTVSRKLNKLQSPNCDYDLELTPSSDLSGLSGAPLFIGNMLVGIIIDESIVDGQVNSLGCASVELFMDCISKDYFIESGDNCCDNIEVIKTGLKNYYKNNFSSIEYLDNDPTDIKDLTTNLVSMKKNDVKNYIKENIYKSYSNDIDKYKDSQHFFNNKKLKLEDIIKDEQNILICGDPGVGKTLFCKSIAYKWALNELWEEIIILFYIPLKKWSETICDTFLDFVLTEYFGEIKCSINTMELHDFIQKSRDKVIFIFDGIDELSDAKRKEFDTKRKQLNYSFNIYTSKSYLAKRYTNFEQYQLIGFNENDVKKYISSYIKSEKNEFWNYLKETPMLLNLSNIPIFLEILCIIWKQNKARIDTTLTSILKECINILLTDYQTKQENEDIIESRDDIMNLLSYIAFEMSKKKKLYLSGQELDEIITDCPLYINGLINESSESREKFLKEKLIRCNLLKVDNKKIYIFNCTFTFPHDVFQYYFTAHYISKLEEDKFKKTINDYKYIKFYMDIFIFLSNLLSVNKEKLDKFINFLLESEDEYVDEYLSCLLFSCLGNFFKRYQYCSQKIKKVEILIDRTVEKDSILLAETLYKYLENNKYLFEELMLEKQCSVIEYKHLFEKTTINNNRIINNLVQEIEEYDCSNIVFFKIFEKIRLENKIVIQYIISRLCRSDDIQVINIDILANLINGKEEYIDILILKLENSNFWYEKYNILRTLIKITGSSKSIQDRINIIVKKYLEDKDDCIRELILKYLIDKGEINECTIDTIIKLIENQNLESVERAVCIKHLGYIYHMGICRGLIKETVKAQLDKEDYILKMGAIEGMRNIGYHPHNYIKDLLETIVYIGNQDFLMIIVLEKACSILVDIVAVDDGENGIVTIINTFLENIESFKRIMIYKNLILKKVDIECIKYKVKELMPKIDNDEELLYIQLYLYQIYGEDNLLEMICENIDLIKNDFEMYNLSIRNLSINIEKYDIIKNLFLRKLEEGKNEYSIIFQNYENTNFYLSNIKSCINYIDELVKCISLSEIINHYSTNDELEILMLIKEKILRQIIPITFEENKIIIYEEGMSISLSISKILKLKKYLLDV